MRRSLSSLVLFLFVSVVSLQFGCTTMIDGMPPGPAHEAYQPLESAEAEAFFFQCLEKAQEQFGAPEVPVTRVLFRRSRKTEAAARYRIAENFSLTQCIDSTNGVFVVYIGEDPDGRNFYPLLAHESAHLLNARIMDWYMEGLATAFSEEMCAQHDKAWGDWGRHFRRTRKDPYGRSYRMMRDLKAAFPQAYPSIIRYTRPNGKNTDWLYIDIDRWLDTLDDDGYAEALDIIEPHLKTLQKYDRVYYTIQVPAALK
ncbi:hypothetical protein [Pontiella sp.]|uniref:hypothetical protein n=1 Tax=Pontiella sp. TaxID=2837462 RepID=UPI00356992B4